MCPGGTYPYSLWDRLEVSEFVDATIRVDLAVTVAFESVTIDPTDAFCRAPSAKSAASSSLEPRRGNAQRALQVWRRALPLRVSASVSRPTRSHRIRTRSHAGARE